MALSSPPSDSVSDLSFCAGADLLAAASWDGTVRLWDVKGGGGGASPSPIATYCHQGPVLCTAWEPTSGELVYSGVSLPLVDHNNPPPLTTLAPRASTPSPLTSCPSPNFLPQCWMPPLTLLPFSPLPFSRLPPLNSYPSFTLTLSPSHPPLL